MLKRNAVVEKKPLEKNALSLETLVFIGVSAAVFGFLGTKMGAVNMLNTMMNTAYDLLINTVLYIMAIAVMAGAFSGLLTEFGVIAAINKILSPLIKPIYGCLEPWHCWRDGYLSIR